MTSILKFISILKNDYYLWFIYIPILIVIHKVSVFSTYYNCLSRTASKHKQITVDYIVLAISSFIVSILVIFLPITFMKLAYGADLTNEVVVNVLFLVIRYNVLGLLIQCIAYSLLFMFPVLQRFSNVICVMPILLCIILMFPFEWLTANSFYVAALDFSAGKYYVFILENNIVLWDACFFHNIHLIGYSIAYSWLSINYLSRKMEYLENEDKNT